MKPDMFAIGKKKLKSVIRMEREEGLSDLKYYILNKLRGARSGRILFS